MGTVKLTKEFVVSYSGKTIARCTDFDFEVNRQTIDITSLDSDGWREIVADMKEWRINFNGMVTRGLSGSTQYDDLMDDIKNSDDAVAVFIKSSTTGDKYETGNAFLTSLRASGAMGDSVKYSGTLEGTGKLETATV